jgi:hypothetical protein
VVLNAVPPRSGIGREAAEGLAGQGMQVAPVMLSKRAAFAHGVIDGRTAQEFEPGGRAADEVERLYLWLEPVQHLPSLHEITGTTKAEIGRVDAYRKQNGLPAVQFRDAL